MPKGMNIGSKKPLSCKLFLLVKKKKNRLRLISSGSFPVCLDLSSTTLSYELGSRIPTRSKKKEQFLAPILIVINQITSSLSPVRLN